MSLRELLPFRRPPRRPTVEVTATQARFRQKFDMFNRASWDPAVRSAKTDAYFAAYEMPYVPARTVDGCTPRDYALRNASWHVANLMTERDGRREGFTDPYTCLAPGAESPAALAPEEGAAELKRAARLLGADLVGIAEADSRWLYSHSYSRPTGNEAPVALPDGMNRAIVLAVRMPEDALRTTPSALSGAASGLGYSQMAALVVSVAQFVRNLGYNAIPSMNDTGPTIPLAIQAGLGEYGRNGLLITREFGPRVRLAKVFTDMPLALDAPIRFGVAEFCAICRQCARACKIKAIPDGEPTNAPRGLSNSLGVRKWTVDAEKCFTMWTNQNAECAICIRVCPYNKDYSRRVHRLGRALAATPLRGLLLRVERRWQFGQRVRPRDWWRA